MQVTLENGCGVLICWYFMTDCRFPKKLESHDMLCELSSPVAKATDGGLKCLIRVSVKVSGLEGPACWSSTTTKEVGCPLGCCCTLGATWLC